MFVCNTGARTISKVTSTGVVSVLAGSTVGFADGLGTAATFSAPYGIAKDSAGNLYVSDSSNHNIRKITPAGRVSTFAGSNAGAGAVVDYEEGQLGWPVLLVVQKVLRRGDRPWSGWHARGQ